MDSPPVVALLGVMALFAKQAFMMAQGTGQPSTSRAAVVDSQAPGIASKLGGAHSGKLDHMTQDVHSQPRCSGQLPVRLG